LQRSNNNSQKLLRTIFELVFDDHARSKMTFNYFLGAAKPLIVESRQIRLNPGPKPEQALQKMRKVVFTYLAQNSLLLNFFQFFL
jgi:hypothetical protein